MIFFLGKGTIADVVKGNNDLSRLFKILTDTKVIATFTEKGPFTLFAPDNDAFSKVKDYLNNLSTDKLKEIVLMHVVKGNEIVEEYITAGENNTSKTVGGKDILIKREQCRIQVRVFRSGGAKVINADIRAVNGVIHVIDNLILEKIMDVLEQNSNFSTFAKAVNQADLSDYLNGNGPFTVFAPTNTAFQKLNRSILPFNNPAFLRNVTLRHIYNGTMNAGNDITDDTTKTFKSAVGTNIEIIRKNNITTVNPGEAKVIRVGLKARNGIIHAIDNLLLETQEN